MTKASEHTSILRKEILSQPDVLARVLEREAPRARRLAARIAAYDPQLVLVVARGSADNAGLYGKYLFGAHNRKVVALATPSLFTRYGRPPELGRALVLAISQSGESFDVVEVVEEANRAGALTVAVTNTPGSPLAKQSRLLIKAASNIGGVTSSARYGWPPHSPWASSSATA